jgi:hypothetical protein
MEVNMAKLYVKLKQHNHVPKAEAGHVIMKARPCKTNCNEKPRRETPNTGNR